MSFIQQEIEQQPQVIANLLREGAEGVRAIAAAIHAYNPSVVLLVARGTSDNAARYAQYLFSVRAGLLAALATPSVHTLYDTAPNLSRALVIGISQSGASEDIRRVMTDAREQGALTVAITNNPASPLAAVADHCIDLQAGEERSVAATKTYIAEIMAVAMLVEAIVGKNAWAMLDTLPGVVEKTLTDSLRRIPQWVERYRYMTRFAAIGRGYNYATAFEIGLKIKELCYISGEPYSEADFQHGPMALVEAGYPVILVMPSGATYARLRDLLDQLRQREAETLVITDMLDIRQVVTQFMPLPADTPEWLSPIPAVVPGQVFAMQLAAVRGLSLDKPRGLQKVTNTR